MFKSRINFSKGRVLFALELDAATTLVHLPSFNPVPKQKVGFIFQFSVGAYKSLPMFLKRTLRRFPSGYTCGAFSQTFAGRLPRHKGLDLWTPWLDGWAGNVQLTTSARLVPVLLVHIRACPFLNFILQLQTTAAAELPFKSWDSQWSILTSCYQKYIYIF